jgi:hypothetical protein
MAIHDDERMLWDYKISKLNLPLKFYCINKLPIKIRMH